MAGSLVFHLRHIVGKAGILPRGCLQQELAIDREVVDAYRCRCDQCEAVSPEPVQPAFLRSRVARGCKGLGGKAGTVRLPNVQMDAVGSGERLAPSWMSLLIPKPDTNLPTLFFFF